MGAMHYYRAPWDGLLKVVTVFSTLLLVALSSVPLQRSPLPPPVKAGIVALSVAIVLGTWAFAPRGYEIDGHRLIVRRNLGSSEYELRGLREINAQDVKPFRGAIRLFGVGGMFGYYGKFRSSSLGTFTAWVTDRDRAVALKLADGTVVVSPDDPDMFSYEVRASAGMV
jgi:hypothetical protein